MRDPTKYPSQVRFQQFWQVTRRCIWCKDNSCQSKEAAHQENPYCARPCAAGSPAQGKRKGFKFIEFVNTPDRARFLVDSMATARQWRPKTMLSGQNRFIKSMCCLALAILTQLVQGGDVLAFPKADMLAGGATAAELCDSLFAPMLRLSCGLVRVSYSMHCRLPPCRLRHGTAWAWTCGATCATTECSDTDTTTAPLARLCDQHRLVSVV